ncbi:nitrogenase component 1, partial [Chloroflexota bacterium]
MIVKNANVEERHYMEPGAFFSDMIGAYEAFAGIKGSFVLSHVPAGCGLMIREVMLREYYDEGETCSTALWERDVIFSGEDKLRRGIIKALKIFKPAFIGIVPGTAATLIGDDMDGVVNSTREWLAEEHGIKIPIISVRTSALEGNKITGFNLATEALVEKVVAEPAQKRTKTVNIFGVMGEMPNANADAMEMRRLLGELGIEVNEVFISESEVEDIQRAAEANLNIVVSEVLGVEAAKKMDQRFGIPYIVVPYPIGVTNTKRFLQEAASHIGVEKGRVNKLIAKEVDTVKTAMRKASFTAAHVRVTPFIGSKAIVVGDSTHVLGITRFLKEEWGVNPALLALRTHTEESLELLRGLEKELGIETQVLLDPSQEQINDAIEEIKPYLVLGGSYERLALRNNGLDKAGTVFVHIATYPTSVNFDGGRYDIFPHPFAG